jgi:RNA polymerase sigma factor (TIGR02999 family)
MPIAPGEPSSADRLFPIVYDELRALADRFMQRERVDHTLQPTAVVHEAYLRLVGERRIEWRGRAHFFAAAATIIRRILIQHARMKQAGKRGGGARTRSLTQDPADEHDSDLNLLTLNEGLDRLAELNERQARVVELRFFGGLGVTETAQVLDVSPRTVKADWRIAQAWLRAYLSH